MKRVMMNRCHSGCQYCKKHNAEISPDFICCDCADTFVCRRCFTIQSQAVDANGSCQQCRVLSGGVIRRQSSFVNECDLCHVTFTLDKGFEVKGHQICSSCIRSVVSNPPDQNVTNSLTSSY